MDGGGFEPPKQFAADLQSVPFGHSGIHPYQYVLTALNYNIYQNKVQENLLLPAKETLIADQSVSLSSVIAC